MIKSIAFFDTEINPDNHKITDIGCIKSNHSTFHKGSVDDFVNFISDAQFICGHNIFNHDLKYLNSGLSPRIEVIDTLYLSPLLFPTKPYHHLLKDEKLQSGEINNPLNDAIKARDLFYDEVGAFRQVPDYMKEILFHLLNYRKEFRAFFRYLQYAAAETDLGALIHQKFYGYICQRQKIGQLIQEAPVELAYALSLIHSFIQNKKAHSITPPWVLKNYPHVEAIMLRLRNFPCIEGCAYCNEELNALKGLRHWFGYESYRTYGGEALQEQAVNAALANKSLLAVFPTGGGKSITFQVPALMSGENTGGLTIVISPLQSLMKDQVDNLEKAGISEAVTINGLLDPIERSKSFERVEDGSATILYISPESLRSKSIERLILGRKIIRFVIDEAHCFSAWGQDFRVDYLYIGDFIRSVQEKKNLAEGIPVSCFTATAKQKVIEDIRSYFREKLSLDMELFTSSASRTNLHYRVMEKKNDEEKYQTLRDLIQEKKCPAIIYVSRTHRAFMLAKRLSDDGIHARPYHGKMDLKEKTVNQDAFISGEVQVMVATSAFGMGVDKKDVGMVIHYDISDSLENYIQEAGRAGRDETMSADCFVLFNEEDLSKHFILLNQTKLSIKEIQQVWKAIKDITKFRSKVSNSALEIARKAGWDDSVMEIETRVTTAIAALEDAGYLHRGQNMPRIFANSILTKNAQEAMDKITASEKFKGREKEQAVRIIKKLFSSKSRKPSKEDEGESRVDYISDHLGIIKEEVINIINLLREENILADTKDLTAFIRRGENENRSLNIVESFCRIENFLLPLFTEEEKTFHIKELNEEAESQACEGATPNKIKSIINFWCIKNWISRQSLPYSKNHFAILALHPQDWLKEKLAKRHELAKFIVEHLYAKSRHQATDENPSAKEVLVEFSVHELKTDFEKQPKLFETPVSIDDIEDTLFYLSRIEAIKIEGGFLVIYNRLTVERLERNNKINYKNEDYQKLNQFYENKVQQIHIVGEYAKKMIHDYREALQFVEDYFQLNYSSFLQKYFKGSRQNEIKRNITPAKFRQLFGELSATQLNIINDYRTQYMLVAAGPGSGKTRVLVHKLAALLLMEDVKHEQLLMVTFSRSAATEFKKRLLKLIGNAANFVEIKTFHSYCFDLLGKVGSIEKSNDIIKKTIEKINNKEVEINRITKTVLVIDEAQDMDADEFELIKTLMKENEEMRVIAVGDDDQNIYEFRGASSKYIEKFGRIDHAVKHELIENYRSAENLVDFSNQFVQRIQHRLKSVPIVSKHAGAGHIKLIQYRSENLITPLVYDILKTDLAGTTCVLTRTNEEALHITGLLVKNGLQASLIQTNDGFNLYNLAEIRFFLKQLRLEDGVFVITNDLWESAKRNLADRFRSSTQYNVCTNLIRDFESTHPNKKYRTDLEAFIRESKLEDFFNANGETIFVSTMHKSKGREFDNVFLLLENYKCTTDADKRLLYVAMTRAKGNLTIHVNTNIFDGIHVGNFERHEDKNIYYPPSELAMHLSFKDVWLDYFVGRQYYVSQLKSGDLLTFNGQECLNSNGKPVLRFSKDFTKQIEEMKERNYFLRSVKVNFIVYWNREEEKEVKVILPEVRFGRGNFKIS